ncbi:uncharacterized protein LOC118433679 [Folsomia candida]|uniref:uncharacterized protein LOC118433679 n=1 Tax=Folsomia candida TaxID=158441 RepID=UPI001604C70C|nr:uncharacterized protein LOC118433679 [Folsomia candida]
MPTNEMNTCRVKFSVKLDQLSEKLSTKVKNVIKSSPSTVLEKEFDFFVPPMWSADSIAETSPEITTVTEEIEEWISDSYSSFVSPVYGERLANHAVSYILRIFPSYPLGDAKFRILCYYFIVAFILDDYFDDNTGEGDGDDSAETKKIKYFETATNTIGEMFEMKGVGGGKDEIGMFFMKQRQIIASNFSRFQPSRHEGHGNGPV